MKTSMARSLVLRWTRPGDLVVDPFCGCGVVALEAAAHGRHVVVGDWNPYAVLLTRAKLFAPSNQSALAERCVSLGPVRVRASFKS
jgi:adenine-specific DNA methylase